MVIRAGYGLTNDPYSLARHLRTNHPILLALNVTAANSLVAAGKLKDGIPTITAPDLGNGIIDVPTRVAINSTLPEYVRGYVQSWNLTLEKELLWGFTGQVGYVGTRQIKQLGFLDLNAGRVGGGNASKPFNQKFGRNVLTRAIGPIGNSIYDSLQGGLQKRFSNGYQLQASYTWSKSLGIANTANSDGDPNIKIPEYYHLNYGVTPIHTPHNFQLTSIIELPFGQGKRWANGGGAASAILGGWQVNNIVALIAGQYFTVNASGTSLDAPENTQRADYAKEGKPVIIGGAGPGQSFFDPFFFKPVTGARFGTSSFNSVQGPGTVNLDFGLFRNFRISERIQLQFRAEAFNLTNTPHFANPPDAGRNVSNMILNTDGSIRSLGGYTVLNAVKNGGREGVDERVFRFGVRLSF